MSYQYADIKEKLFTDEGQRMFLKIRDNAKTLIAQAGCFMAQNAWSCVTGDSWLMLACIDRMVELNEIRELTREGTFGQHRVFVSL